MGSYRASPAGSSAGFLVFFLVAFGLPWSGWIAIRFMPAPGPLWQALAMFWFPAAVSVAGFVAAFADGGRPALGAFVRRVSSVRFAPWLWLAALALPLLAAALTFAIHPADLLRGGHPLWARLLAPLTFANLWTGPLAEEFGWRGYLLPRFSRRFSPVVAGLAIGPIWALWHVPLFYDSVYAHVDSACSFVAWVTAWSVVMSLVVARCRGSVLPSILIHFLINTQVGFAAALLPALPQDRLPGGFPFTVASVVVALALAWAWRPGRGRRNGTATAAKTRDNRNNRLEKKGNAIF